MPILHFPVSTQASSDSNLLPPTILSLVLQPHLPCPAIGQLVYLLNQSQWHMFTEYKGMFHTTFFKEWSMERGKEDIEGEIQPDDYSCQHG